MTPNQVFPMVVILSCFVFVLLIILLTKAPKAGVWMVPGLILAMVFGIRFLRGSAGLPIFPLLVIWSSFIFVLFMILLGKAPKLAAGLVIALLVMVVLGVFIAVSISHQRAAPTATVAEYPATRVIQQTEDGAGRAVAVHEFDRVFESYVQPPSASTQVLSPGSIPPAPPASAPIWAQGVEAELDADIYPSKLAAVRVLGSRMDRLTRKLPLDVNVPVQIVLFQQDQDRDLVMELRNGIQKVLPAASCTIEAEPRNVRPTEIMATLQLADIKMERAPWAKSDEVKAADGRIRVTAFAAGDSATMQARFVEKPWVGDFAAFTSVRPEQHFIVTRSNDACTSESEAHQQALNDARARLTEALGRSASWKLGKLPRPEITSRDVLDGFVIDRFTQSFAGSAGRIWRQALLIDVSGPKLTRLADQKALEMQALRMSWARMGLSAVGVVVLIAVIYFFLNMATMGYYEWSLRIAGVVLAIVAVISILMIVQ